MCCCTYAKRKRRGACALQTLSRGNLRCEFREAVWSAHAPSRFSLPAIIPARFLIGKLSAFLMLEMALVPDREQSACFNWIFTVMFPYGNIEIML